MTQLFAGEITPDFRGIYGLWQAQEEIESCRSIFQSWKSEADRLGVKGKGYRDIVVSIENLCKDVKLAVLSSRMILYAQITFSEMMEDLFDAAAYAPDHNIGDLSDGVMEMADEIAMQSDKLSKCATSMKKQLKRLADMVEDEDKKREKSIWQKIWEWLKQAFQIVVNAFSSIEVSVSTGKLPRLSSTPLTEMAKSIGNTRAVKCTSSDVIAFVHFLRYQLPNELQQAKESLTRFQHFHKLLEIENARLTGSEVRMSPIECTQARNEWRAYRKRLQQNGAANGRSQGIGPHK